ncbi:MAG: phenylalanine--tRNA ligase subunit beta [Candidatus Marsarchaeota archaeon]|jgi:phenylalanyl-tRNA synthetase beta chain|nr:phenylalanine--tRNA ligase subunit beta [Candidatus Marsarchaeota archaeon]MCL5419976.1 phenylalanine--tRNA ligase subunit beta [Candidatus Marsarchaeota archaeon]
MPVITINKRYLARLLEGKTTDKSLEAQLSKLGLNVESINDSRISVEVTSNRPDLIWTVGLSRAIRHFVHRTRKVRYAVKGGDPAISINVGSSVGSVRPYIAGLVARGLKLDDDSLADFLASVDKFSDTFGRARRKIAVGMHNLDFVSGQLEYDAYGDEAFRPLGCDKELSYKEILEDTEKGRRYAGAITGAGKRQYPALKDSNGTLAFIPIINSERTRVTKSTKDLLIDVTGTSEYLINKTADLLAANFIDMGGEISRVQVNYGKRAVLTPQMSQDDIVVPIAAIEGDLGVKIGANNAATLGGKMGYAVSYTGSYMKFTVPAYRFDVLNDQDVIEDLAIAYGYDYIRPVPVRSVQQGSLDPLTIFRSRAEEGMIGLGFTQMMNSYLSNDALNFTKMRLEPDGSAVRIKNPKSEAITIMRTWIMPSLLKNISLSLNERSPLEAFELDMAFAMKGRKASEEYRLAAVSTDPKSNFNSIKSVFEALAGELGIAYGLKRLDHRSFIPGRCASILVRGKEAGLLGELHPEVLNNFGIEEATAALEIIL